MARFDRFMAEVAPAALIISLIVVAAIALVGFGLSEQVTRPHPGLWALIGFTGACVVTTLGSAVALSRARWSHVALFAAAAACLISVAAFVSSTQPGGRTCRRDRAEFPDTPGARSCDMSYGFGLPFGAVALFPVTFAVSAFGYGVGTRLHRRRQRSVSE